MGAGTIVVLTGIGAYFKAIAHGGSLAVVKNIKSITLGYKAENKVFGTADVAPNSSAVAGAHSFSLAFDTYAPLGAASAPVGSLLSTLTLDAVTPLAVHNMEITEKADNKEAVESDSAPDKITAEGRHSWTAKCSILCDAGKFPSTIVPGYIVTAATLTAISTGTPKTWAGGAIVDAVDNWKADVEGSGLIGCDITLSGMGACTSSDVFTVGELIDFQAWANAPGGTGVAGSATYTGSARINEIRTSINLGNSGVVSSNYTCMGHGALGQSVVAA
jgi:hypothetical protein